MKKSNVILIFILSCVFNLQGISQIKKAEKHFQLFNYAKAIPFLINVVESDDTAAKSKAIPMLADCYRFINDNGRARLWYEKAVLINGADPVTYFYLGQVYRGLGLYEEAAGAFSKYMQICTDTLQAQKFYDYSVQIQEWMHLPPMAEIKNIETLNTRYSEFCPVIYKNGLIFTSDRKRDDLDDTYGWTNFNYLNLYYAEPEYYKDFWGPVKPSIEKQNRLNQNYHDGPAVFTPDFNRIYITRTTEKEGRKRTSEIVTSELKIFFSDITDEKKLKFIPLPFNNQRYSVGHPAISPDGKKLIFSTDMPGGFGDSDLYISIYENGNWSTPENLGGILNTAGNEIFPYWASDSVLFFSSNYHLGYGGLDIFKTVLTEANNWTEPENLKTPINSSYDDFGIIFTGNMAEGLFCSNRPGGKGSDDIYAFRNIKYHEGPANNAFPKEVKKGLMLHGYVKENETGLSIDDATVFFFDPTKADVFIYKSNPEGYFEIPGEFDRNYMVKAMKNGFIYNCISFSTPTEGVSKSFKIPNDLMLSKLEINKVLTVENIYYDLGKWIIREDAKPSLNNLVQIMKNYPISAELSSHTDSRSSNEYNMELSQKRAESAVRYIILQGINPLKISARGYGETRLLNHCSDGVSCTEEQHQVNRRTEFKITSIDNSFIGGGLVNPDFFKYGDSIDIKMLEPDFFYNCQSKQNE